MDPTSLRISRPDGSEKTEPKAMLVLVALTGSAGRVVSRQELEGEVWAGRIVTADTVAKTVGKLRESLDHSRKQPQFIETVPKRGYRLIPKPRPPRTQSE